MNKQAGRKFISDLKSYSDFLGWNEKEIFDQSDYITIYGGAVRDSIAGMM